MSPRAVRAAAGLETAPRKAMNRWASRLKRNPFVGDQIPRGRLPPEIVNRNGLPAPLMNAWRFELPLAFRGIYTVAGHPTKGTVVAILEILSEREYGRLFRYR